VIPNAPEWLTAAVVIAILWIVGSIPVALFWGAVADLNELTWEDDDGEVVPMD
jgi:hypothetical protein